MKEADVALPDDSDALAWIEYLARVHDADLPSLRELNSLYEGTAPLMYLHPDILREVEDRIQAVALGWPMLAVDPLEERLDVVGFAYPEDDDPDPDATPEELASAIGDKNLAQVWEDNDLDTESQMGHVDALVMRRAYIEVGTNDDGSTDSPLTTIESPLEAFALIDPRTRKPRGYLKRWKDDYSFATQTQDQFATLKMPNYTAWFDRGPTGWREIGRDPHMLGTPPVAVLTNRGRLADRYGRSELTPPLLSLSNAANKIATDMMVAAEFHAIPMRALFGVGPEDFEDASGNRLSGLQLIMSRLLTVPDGGEGSEPVRAHEFSASSLTNFHDTLGQLARHASGLIGLDPSAMGMTAGDNPASAEALRWRDNRTIKRAERKGRAFGGGGWNRWSQLVRRFQDGDWDPKARRVKTLWRDPATPTRSQAADAALKLVGGGKPIITVQQAREDLGYTPAQQRRMEAQEAAAGDPLADIARELTSGRPAPVETVPAVEPVPVDVD